MYEVGESEWEQLCTLYRALILPFPTGWADAAGTRLVSTIFVVSPRCLACWVSPHPVYSRGCVYAHRWQHTSRETQAR